jgi:rubrerythrin
MPGRSSFHTKVTNQKSKEKKSQKTSETEIEILKEGTECSHCHFTNLKREESEIVCPVCGYGYRPCT